MTGPANKTIQHPDGTKRSMGTSDGGVSTFSFSRASLTGLVERGTGATGWDSLESAMAIRAECPRVNS